MLLQILFLFGTLFQTIQSQNRSLSINKLGPCTVQLDDGRKIDLGELMQLC